MQNLCKKVQQSLTLWKRGSHMPTFGKGVAERYHGIEEGKAVSPLQKGRCIVHERSHRNPCKGGYSCLP